MKYVCVKYLTSYEIRYAVEQNFQNPLYGKLMNADGYL